VVTEDLRELLGLSPHPEGGWYARTWAAPQRFQPDGYPGLRNAATAIYYLLRPGEVSRWHRVRSDELWLWHRGGPLELALGGRDATPAQSATVLLLGPDLAAGDRPQLLVPGGVWQSARPAGRTEVLVSCVVSPGYADVDFALA
jgi:predicted cupin superfamily sugar epimerase